VGDEEIEASKCIVLATGSVARPIPGVEFGGRVIGTEEAWALEQMPGSLAVLGAGASGTEIASAYARLGADVILLEMLDRVLPAEDPDISKVAERGFKRQGIKVVTGTPVENVEAGDSSVTFSYGGEQAEVDWLVIAAGRAPDVEGLGLDDAGVERQDDGLVEVDGALRTSREGVYAIGDLVHGPALGLTEEQARENGHDVVVGKVQYGAVGAGTVYGDRTGMIKIIGDTKYGELIGGHIVGTRATELIQELVNAKALEGGFSEVARIIHGHPTLSEAVMEAARAADGWLIHG
jgi:dihydrolipoamide dehydrogenase